MFANVLHAKKKQCNTGKKKKIQNVNMSPLIDFMFS